jgi:hypothetical protein
MGPLRKTVTAATVVASIAAGGVVGAAIGTPTIAAAGGTATSAAGWVRDALSGLVEDGTIDQGQADAVAAALEEARPERGWRHPHLAHHLGLQAVAESLGIAEDELRAALVDGRTIAEVAAERGVDVQVVVDAIVAAQRERVDEEVADGDLTREQADEILAGAEERAGDLVAGELPMRRGHRGGAGPFGDERHGPRGRGPTADDPTA